MPVPVRHRVNRRLQLGKDRKLQRLAWLLLAYVQQAVTDVLRSHTHDVAAPLRGVEQQLQREPGAGAEGIVLAKGRNLFLAPGAEAFALPRDYPPVVCSPRSRLDKRP